MRNLRSVLCRGGKAVIQWNDSISAFVVRLSSGREDHRREHHFAIDGTATDGEFSDSIESASRSFLSIHDEVPHG